MIISLKYIDPLPLIEILLKKKINSIELILLLKNEYKSIQALINDHISKTNSFKSIQILNFYFFFYSS